jgi:hypothetical protein
MLPQLIDPERQRQRARVRAARPCAARTAPAGGAGTSQQVDRSGTPRRLRMLRTGRRDGGVGSGWRPRRR